MDAPEIKKFDGWGFIKKNPLIYFPILVIIINAITHIIFDLDPLAEAGSSMILCAAFGAQWIGMLRNRESRKIDGLIADKNLLKTHMELSQMVGEPMVRFLVPYHGTFTSRTWNKVRNRTVLSLYKTRNIGNLTSFTKFYVTKKEMFELKLKGCINTDDGELALKGITLLNKRRTLKITL